jgi:hypothetical protein
LVSYTANKTFAWSLIEVYFMCPNTKLVEIIDSVNLETLLIWLLEIKAALISVNQKSGWLFSQPLFVGARPPKLTRKSSVTGG